MMINPNTRVQNWPIIKNIIRGNTMNIIKSTIILGLVVQGMAVAHGLDKGKKFESRAPMVLVNAKQNGVRYYAHDEGDGQWMGVHKKFVNSLKKDQRLHFLHLQGIQAAKESGDIDGSFLADHQKLVQGNFLKSLNPKQKDMLQKLVIGQDIIGNGGDTDDVDMSLGNVAQEKLTAKKDKVAAKKATLQGMFGEDDADADADTDGDT